MSTKPLTLTHRSMELILGPPGTGKTTTLLNIMKRELANGVAPNKIAYVSFTRKAAEVALHRATDCSRLGRDDLPWFRTLHSLAFRCLSLERRDVFGRGDCIELGKSLGLYIGGIAGPGGGEFLVDDPWETAGGGGGAKGTMMMFLDNLARVRCETLQETWQAVPDDRVSWEELQWFSASYLSYRRAKGLLDFTDMIGRWTYDGGYSDGRSAFRPPLDVVIVDEAQDLTRLQWLMVERLIAGAKRVFISGDDDQAIYTWSGADVESFLHLCPSRVSTLAVSHRLPRALYQAAVTISARIHNRYAKDWGPKKTGELGRLDLVTDLDEVGLDTGEWLILLRNRAFIDDVADYCTASGFSFSAPGVRPLESDALTAIRHWEELRKGRCLTAAEVRIVYQHLAVGSGVGRGFKMLPGVPDHQKLSLDDLETTHGLRTREVWHDALARIPVKQREYYREVLRRGDSLRSPRIVIGTIHSAKGGESENVLLYQDQTARTALAFYDDPDPEHRVFYVGATRARSRLVVMNPTSNYSYPVIN